MESDRLELVYVFWNARRGLFVFDGFVGVCDLGAVGATVGGAVVVTDSEFLRVMVKRHYEAPLEVSPWHEFEFLDLDGAAVLRVVAERCRFSEM